MIVCVAAMGRQKATKEVQVQGAQEQVAPHPYRADYVAS